NRLFIIGGGHCSLALSRLMRSMDFYVTVYDERNNLKTMLENDAAHEKHIIDSYDQLKELVPAGDTHYVVIMTFGYRTDEFALRALMHNNFRYLGLLGSKTKVEKLLNDYQRQGIPPAILQRIRSPIGLPIKSQTPEEIAVSIAAEIIQVKNKDAQ
ncbi:MAG: XdhC family protein, partial [Chitinophagaceae bacterium]|nr:XdhC family protein [Chitinophagaceae bacterium]